MRVVKLIAVIILVSCVFSKEEAKEEHVLEFNDFDFDSKISEHEIALVMFYSPWCRYCKTLKPKFAKAAEGLIGHNPPVALVKVDCSGAGPETCRKYHVRGYPTLKIFRKGNFFEDYRGRDADGIIEYMKHQAAPPSVKRL